jgi:hypothetical protein
MDAAGVSLHFPFCTQPDTPGPPWFAIRHNKSPRLIEQNQLKKYE